MRRRSPSSIREAVIFHMLISPGWVKHKPYLAWALIYLLFIFIFFFLGGGTLPIPPFLNFENIKAMTMKLSR